MATYTASQAKTITLVSSTVDTVTLTGTGKTIRFVATSNKGHVYYTLAQPSQTPPNPTVAGDDCFVTSDTTVHDHPWTNNGCVVKVIASGTPTITIALID